MLDCWHKGKALYINSLKPRSGGPLNDIGVMGWIDGMEIEMNMEKDE